MDPLTNRLWWAVALRGVFAVLFGLLAFILPGITLAALITLFGVFAFVDGVFLLVAGVRAARYRQPRWWVLLPGLTALSLLYLMAFWAIFTGAFEIVFAVSLRKEIENEWMLGLSGFISILLGILFLAIPEAGLLAWVWMIGAYALLSGVLMLVLGFRLRRLIAQRPRPRTVE
jgi:uncharacterized membrane protein HdeD (DUF308 family)